MIEITINGKRYQVNEGTSVAAAILNNRIARRSIELDRRMPVCGMGTCFECIAEIDGLKEERTCLLKVREGMDIRYQ